MIPRCSSRHQASTVQCGLHAGHVGDHTRGRFRWTLEQGAESARQQSLEHARCEPATAPDPSSCLFCTQGHPRRPTESGLVHDVPVGDVWTIVPCEAPTVHGCNLLGHFFLTGRVTCVCGDAFVVRNAPTVAHVDIPVPTLLTQFAAIGNRFAGCALEHRTVGPVEWGSRKWRARIFVSKDEPEAYRVYVLGDSAAEVLTRTLSLVAELDRRFAGGTHAN